MLLNITAGIVVIDPRRELVYLQPIDVWRRRGEQFAQARFSPRVHFDEGSVMLLEGRQYEACTELRALPTPAQVRDVLKTSRKK